MTIKIRELLMWLVILFLLAGNVWQFIRCKDCPKSAERVVETRIDTIYKRGKVKIDTVIIPQPEIVKVKEVEIKRDTVTENVEIPSQDSAIKIFRDTIWAGLPGQGVGLKYYHLIHGYLLDSKYEIDYPQTTIINANRTYVRDYKHQVYLMSGLTTDVDFADVVMGAAYVKNDLMLYYHWSLARNIHTAGIGYRLFKR